MIVQEFGALHPRYGVWGIDFDGLFRKNEAMEGDV
jgi:hypothetical protein